MQEALIKTRQELSHALYQHDAACHVVARLQKENEELRNRLLSTDKRNTDLEA